MDAIEREYEQKIRAAQPLRWRSLSDPVAVRRQTLHDAWLAIHARRFEGQGRSTGRGGPDSTYHGVQIAESEIRDLWAETGDTREIGSIPNVEAPGEVTEEFRRRNREGNRGALERFAGHIHEVGQQCPICGDDWKNRLIEDVARAICEDNCDSGYDQPHCDWDDVKRDATTAVNAVLPEIVAAEQRGFRWGLDAATRFPDHAAMLTDPPPEVMEAYRETFRQGVEDG